MKVILMRASLTDGAHLSAEGRQMVRAIGSKLKNLDEPSFDRFVTSPLPAAIQTAEIFAERVDYVGVIEILPQLVDPIPAKIVVPTLLERGENIVVVGDEPYIASLGAFLIGRPTFPQLYNAQLSCIDDRRPAWFLRPGEIGKRQLIVA